jgi:hypothetical protein
VFLIKNYKNKTSYFLFFTYLLLLAFAVLFTKNINWTTDIKKTNIRIITGDFLAYQGKPVNSHDFIHSYSVKIDGVNKA